MKLPLETPPAFCRIDQVNLLEEREPMPPRYHPVSGTQLPLEEIVTRTCSTEGHDRWLLYSERYIAAQATLTSTYWWLVSPEQPDPAK